MAPPEASPGRAGGFNDHDDNGHGRTQTMSRESQSMYELIRLANGWTVGRFAPLAELGVVHTVTTRAALDVGRISADRAGAAAELAKAMGLEGVAYLQQVHGSAVLAVKGPGPAGQADGLATDRPGLGLMTVSAECPLVMVADRLGAAGGVAHASWRATVGRVVVNLVDLMARRFGCRPCNMVACIGPSAGPCCYEIGPEVLQQVTASLGTGVQSAFITRQGRLYLDLWQANREQLTGAGLDPARIHTAGVCTICHHDTYPSYRREGDQAGRFAAVIAIPPKSR